MGRIGCLYFLFVLSVTIVVGYVSYFSDVILGKATPPSPEKGFDSSTIIMGAVLSALSFATPYIVHWSTGCNRNAFMEIYTYSAVISAGCATFAWLLYSLCQLHRADGRIVGVTTVVIYTIGLTIFCVTLTIKFSPNGVVSGKVCWATVISLLIITIVLMLMALFGPLKRDTRLANIISAIAAVAQLFSSLLPFADLCNSCISQGQAPDAQVPPFRNRRKLSIYMSLLDATFMMYWAIYCIHHYERSTFWLANIMSWILSWISASLSIYKALRPVMAQAERGR
ncbi:uncharacterized protein LOC102705399 [Oryza brachyantha]|uniref:Uncharacterized protein n=1 Tax=Oryza brachyantha TaxID=4533 RepID=J3L2G5_ORYBR|nr:uncharacterized protein LOC102705399 [Oryza brachyantha]